MSVSSIYIEERWLKTRSLLSNPLISVQGHSGWSLSQQIRVQGRTHLDRTPLHGRATHIHSDWDSVDTPIYLTHTALGCGRKQWYPENTTQTWEEVPTPQGQWALPNWFFSQWWLNKTVLLRATVVDIENAYSEMQAIWRGTSTRVEGRVTWTLKLALKTECEQMV